MRGRRSTSKRSLLGCGSSGTSDDKNSRTLIRDGSASASLPSVASAASMRTFLFECSAWFRDNAAHVALVLCDFFH